MRIGASLTDLEREHFETDVVDHTLRLYFAGKKRSGRFLLPEERPGGSQPEPESRAAVEAANEIVRRPSIREQLCKMLERATEDTREVAKIVTSVLLPSALGPHPTVPLNALVFAWVALLIIRAGVQGFCTEPRK